MLGQDSVGCLVPLFNLPFAFYIFISKEEACEEETIANTGGAASVSSKNLKRFYKQKQVTKTSSLPR